MSKGTLNETSTCSFCGCFTRRNWTKESFWEQFKGCDWNESIQWWSHSPGGKLLLARVCFCEFMFLMLTNLQMIWRSLKMELLLSSLQVLPRSPNRLVSKDFLTLAVPYYWGALIHFRCYSLFVCILIYKLRDPF